MRHKGEPIMKSNSTTDIRKKAKYNNTTGKNTGTKNKAKTNNTTNYKSILSESTYRKLLFANLINRFGDSIESIAFTWIVYQITGSAAWSAIIFAFIMLPNVVVQPFAGAIVEKMDKKHVVITTHFLRAILIALFIFLFKLELVTPTLLSVFALTITIVESFYIPATSALSAQVFKRDDINTGVSLNSVFANTATLAGSGIAGFIIAKLGVEAAMFTDLSTFITAAVLIAMLKTEAGSASEADSTDVASKAESIHSFSKNKSAGSLHKTGSNSSIRKNKNASSIHEAGNSSSPSEPGYISMLKDGISYVFSTPVVRNFCIICVLLNGMLIPLNALQVPIVSEIYGMGSELISISGIFSSIGGILGAAVLPNLTKKLSPLKITVLGTALLAGAMACIPYGRFVKENVFLAYTLLCACYFVMMAAASLIGGILHIQLMKCVDRKYMARASAVFNSSSAAVTPIGSLVIGMLVSHVSISQVLTINAAFAAIVLLLIIIKQPVLEKKEEFLNIA